MVDGIYDINGLPTEPNQVEFRGVDINNYDTALLVSPQFSDLADYDNRVRFHAGFDTRTGSSNAELYVGVVSDRNASQGFTALDTINSTVTGTYQEYRVSLSDTALIGNKNRVALAPAGQSRFAEIGLDSFVYEKQPACDFPADLELTAIGSDSASIGWTSKGSGSQWIVQWGQRGFSLGQGTSSTSNSSDYTINNLRASTEYEVYVAEVCGSQDTSRYAGPFTFTTNCRAATAKYSENFDQDTAADPFAGVDCWHTTGNRSFGIALHEDIYGSGKAPTPPNEVQLEIFDRSSGDTAIMVSQPFSDLTDYTNRLRFHAAFQYGSIGSRSDQELLVGVMGNRANPQTFQPLDTITSAKDEVYEQYRVSLSDTSLIGNKRHFAFATDGNLRYNEVELDSIVYEQEPSCDFPEQLSVSGVSSGSVDLEWTSKDTGSQWAIQWGNKGFQLGSGNNDTTNRKPYTLSGLSPSTAYDVYVAEICTAGDTSRYIGPVSFETNCPSKSATYAQNFDNAKRVQPFDSIDCWHIAGNKAQEIALEDGTFRTENPPTLPNEVEFNEVFQLRYGDTALLTGPQFSDLPDYDNRLRFHAAFVNGNRNTNELLIGVMDNRKKASTFTPLDTVTSNKDGEYRQYRVSLNDTTLIGSKSRVAFAPVGQDQYDEIVLDSFVYEKAPSCDFPGNLNVSALQDTSATVGWKSYDTSSQWIVQWGQQGFNLGQGNQVKARTKPYTISGLSPNTTYEVYVAELCSSGDTSRYAGPVQFTTDCSPKGIRYAKNFDKASPSNPLSTVSCWSIGGNEAQTITLANKAFETNNPPTLPNEVKFEEVFRLSNGDTALLITPELSGVGNYNKRIRFQAAFERGDQNTNTLQVGVIRGKNQASTFTSLDTVTANTDGKYKEYRVSLRDSSLIGTKSRLAFNPAGPSQYSAITLDSFVYETKPTCDFPGSLSVLKAKDTSSIISWTSYDSGSQWLIQWGEKGFQLGNGNVKATSSNPDTLTGLQGLTTYEVYVAEVCSSGDTSRYVGPVRFETNCPPSFTAEYQETFDKASGQRSFGNKRCWQQTGNVNQYRINLDDRGQWVNPTSLPNQVLFEGVDLAQGDTGIIVSPALSDISQYDKRLRFQAAFEYNSSRTDNNLFVGVMPNQFDNGALTILDTLNADTAKAYEEFTVALTDTSAIGNKNHIAIIGGSRRYGDIAFDNFTYEDTPSCELPSNLQASNIGQDTATVSWTGNSSSNQWQLQWGKQGFTPGQGNSTTVSSTSYQLSSLSPGTRYDVYVAEICSAGDTSKYRGPTRFKTPCLTDTIPYSQDFSSGFPVCWSRTNRVDVSRVTQCRSQSNALQIKGSAQAKTGKLDVSGAKSLKVSYQVAAAACNVYPGYRDTLKVAYYNGGQWNTAKTYTGDAADNFFRDSFYVKQQSLSQAFKLRYNVTSGSSYDGFQIADLSIQEGPECIPPKDMRFSNVTTSTVDVSWTSVENGPARIVQWGQKGFTLGQGDSASTAKNSYTITGLSPGTKYDVYVAEVCSSGDTSAYRGPFTFNTNCQAKRLPYNQNFSNRLPFCWTSNDQGFVSHIKNCQGQSHALQITNSVYAQSVKLDASSAQSLKVDYELSTKRCGVYSSSRDSLQVEYWNGSKWIVAERYDGTYADKFRKDSLYIQGQALSSDFQLRFNMTNGGRYDGFNIADLSVQEGPSCLPPDSLDAFQITANSAKVSWQSLANSGTRKLQWGQQGFNLGQGDSTTTTNDPYNLSGLSPSTTYDIYVAEVCGGSNPSPYHGPLTFTTRCQAAALPDTNTFAGSSFPGCWLRSSSSGVTIDSTCRSGSNVLNIGMNEEVESPLYDASSYQSVTVAFDWGKVCDQVYSIDTIKFQYWDGASWKTLKSVNGGDAPGSFKRDSIVAANANNLPSDFKFRVKTTGRSSGEIQLDSIVVKQGPSCVKVTNIDTTNLTTTSATITWKSRLSGNQWKVEWGTKGFKPGNGNTALASKSNYTIKGLKANQQYQVYVAEICGGGDTSQYAGPFSFSTPCGVRQAPYHKTFDKATLLNCFTTYGNGKWQNINFPPSFPYNDHTGTGGNFSYAPLSKVNDTAVLETPSVDVNNLSKPEISFYLMSLRLGQPNGANKLTVDIYDGNQWHNQVLSYSSFSRKWVHKTVDLTNYSISGPVKARFDITAKADTPSNHVMLVDDIAFREQSDTVTWYGTNNKQWSDSTNWENGKPGANKTLLIPQGKLRYPNINSQAIGGDLIIRQMNNSPLIKSGERLTLNGNLVNQGKADLGDGVLQLSGSGKTQTVKGSSKLVVDSLEIGNPKGVKLKTNLNIEQSLIFQNGIVSMPNTSHILTFQDNATVTGSSDSTYINGKVTKVGDEAFTFPLGSGGKWARLGISAPSDSTDAFTASYSNSGYTNTSSFADSTNNPNGNTKLQNVSQNEHWKLDRTSGSSNVDVTLYWEKGSASGINDTSELKVAHWNDSAWQNYGKDTVTGSLTSGSITVRNVNSFSPFTFGSTSNNDNPLPVELTSFTAKPENGTVLLTWTTASETNNRHFKVQRRTSGSEDWQTIGRVRGHGTTYETHEYQFVDPEPEAAVQYYRLKQVDFDGAFEYSNVRAVELKHQPDFVINLRGNPVNNRLQMELSLPQSGRYQVQVLSSTGKRVYRENLTFDKGHQNLAIPLKDVANGMYILRIEGSSQVDYQAVLIIANLRKRLAF